MEHEAGALYIVGPTDPTAFGSAVELLSLPEHVDLDIWGADGQWLIFCDDPSLAGGLARAIAVVTEEHAALLEGTMVNGAADAEGAITRHAMNGEGETFATHTVTLTYDQCLDDPQGVLEVEMMNLFEFEGGLEPVE